MNDSDNVIGDEGPYYRFINVVADYNENYRIVRVLAPDGTVLEEKGPVIYEMYAVINNATEVPERYAQNLPEAMYWAHMYHVALTTKAWETVGTEDDAVAPNGAPSNVH